MIGPTAVVAIVLTGAWMPEGTESMTAWIREERVSISISMPEATGSTTGSTLERQRPERMASTSWPTGSTAKGIESRVIWTKKAIGSKLTWIAEVIGSNTDWTAAATTSIADSIIEAIVTNENGYEDKALVRLNLPGPFFMRVATDSG